MPPEVVFSLRWVKLNFIRLVSAVVEPPYQLGATAPSSWYPVITIMTPSSLFTRDRLLSFSPHADRVLWSLSTCWKGKTTTDFRYCIHHLLQRCRNSAFCPHRNSACVFHMISIINRYFFPKLPEVTGLCNGNAVFSMREELHFYIGLLFRCLIQEEIKRRLNSGNASYHSVQNLQSSFCCLKT
jgi:hypothetical protein